MNWLNNKSRYGVLSMGLHWLMLVLLLAVYALMEFRDIYPKGSAPREAMKTWHFMLGLSVLTLTLARLTLRAISPTPDILPSPPRWQSMPSKLLHLALYGLMIGLPIAGWLILSAKGKPIPFFGLELPALIGKNKDIAEWIKEIHEAGATAGYALIGFHAVAALFHHYVIRDNTLRRMLPGRD